MPNLLFVDANILVRCVAGRALENVDDLRARGVKLATTDAQAREAERVLHHRLGLDKEQAASEVRQVVSSMQVFLRPTYLSAESAAKARIDYKNTGDWPILAAAIEHKGAIWTDDRDFFGVGVPTWTTRNIRFVESTGTAGLTF